MRDNVTNSSRAILPKPFLNRKRELVLRKRQSDLIRGVVNQEGIRAACEPNGPIVSRETVGLGDRLRTDLPAAQADSEDDVRTFRHPVDWLPKQYGRKDSYND